VKSVLFVCTGNICRSPIAEGLFRRLLGNRKEIEVASAGVHAVHGQPPSLYAVQVCEEEGVDISGLRSQPLTAALIDRATHIFAMTGAHLETIQMLFPQGAEKSFLLREFEEPGDNGLARCARSDRSRAGSLRRLRAHHQERVAKRARVRRTRPAGPAGHGAQVRHILFNQRPFSSD
jgi:Protein-tyrosine-phosphatase